MKRLLIRLFDWFSQTSSPRWTLDFDDLFSILRTAIMAASSAAISEMVAVMAKEGVDIEINKLVTYVIVAMVLQTLRKWLGSWR
ncbi:MAG: hypothetical protein QXQ02_00110 [Halobacteria archaeon]